MKKNFLLFFIFQSSLTFSQQLSCVDFKEGKFIIKIEKPVNMEFEIIRKDSIQSERPLFIPERFKHFAKKDTVFSKIKWTSECNYSLTFYPKRNKLDSIQENINESGGVSVNMNKIEGKCFYYKSLMKVNEKEIIVNGKICKIE